VDGIYAFGIVCQEFNDAVGGLFMISYHLTYTTRKCYDPVDQAIFKATSLLQNVTIQTYLNAKAN
jgi:hypothetical protein